MNNKFLQEAEFCVKKWKELGLLDGINENFIRDQKAILLESIRLRNEFDGTDEEYQSYLKDFDNRSMKILGSAGEWDHRKSVELVPSAKGL